jgi:hypothetical protein
MMGTLHVRRKPQVQCQPAEVMSNSQLEPNSLNLALSTRVTEHESGTCASPWSHCIGNDSSKRVHLGTSPLVVICLTRTPLDMAQIPT